MAAAILRVIKLYSSTKTYINRTIFVQCHVKMLLQYIFFDLIVFDERRRDC